MELTYREHLRLPNLGENVFRTRPARSMGRALVGSIIAGMIGFIALLLVRLAPPIFGMLVGGLVGALIGLSRRVSRCSAPRCGTHLDPEMLECPGCGGRIVGEVARPAEHLDALEAYEGPESDDDPLP